MSLSHVSAESEEREHRLRELQCGSKRTYTKKGAKSALRMVRAAGQTGMNIYPCPWCTSWHLGHKTK